MDQFRNGLLKCRPSKTKSWCGAPTVHSLHASMSREATCKDSLVTIEDSTELVTASEEGITKGKVRLNVDHIDYKYIYIYLSNVYHAVYTNRVYIQHVLVYTWVVWDSSMLWVVLKTKVLPVPLSCRWNWKCIKVKGCVYSAHFQVRVSLVGASG